MKMGMMTVRNVHQALPQALYQLREYGVRRQSRNGPVVVAPGPVATIYMRPTERVIFWEERDANPFFHLFEALWMLAGRRDVEYIAQFNSQMAAYSDDGETFHGAYGYRWRTAFGFDQLLTIIQALRENPDCRRQVLTMWDAETDLNIPDCKDLPCNTHAYLQRGAKGELNMMVSNRSNDIVWGCYGANAVHFSVLQEFLAAAIGCPVGTYYQISFNWHAYLNTLEPLACLADRANDPLTGVTFDPYQAGAVRPFPLVSGEIGTWMADLRMFLDEGEAAMGYRDPFFRRVAIPMLLSWKAFKADLSSEGCKRALYELNGCEALDWKLATAQWLGRRLTRRLERETKQCQQET